MESDAESVASDVSATSHDSTTSLRKRVTGRLAAGAGAVADGAAAVGGAAVGAVKTAGSAAAAAGSKSAKAIGNKFKPKPVHEDAFPNGMVHSGFDDGELIISNNDWEVDDLNITTTLDVEDDLIEPAHCMLVVERRLMFSIVWIAHLSLFVHLGAIVWYMTEYNRITDYLQLSGIDYFHSKRTGVITCLYFVLFIDFIVNVTSVIGARTLKDFFCDYFDPAGRQLSPDGCISHLSKFLFRNSWIFDVVVLTTALLGSVTLILMFCTAFIVYTSFVWKVMCENSGQLDDMFELLGRNVATRFNNYDATDVCVVIHKVRACTIRMAVAMAIIVIFQIHFVLLAHDARTHNLHEELFDEHAEGVDEAEEERKRLKEQDSFFESHNYKARAAIAEKQVLVLTHQIEAMKEVQESEYGSEPASRAELSLADGVANPLHDGAGGGGSLRPQAAEESKYAAHSEML